MPKMLFDLTDAEREALERYRARMGLRSFTAAVKHLIQEADRAMLHHLAQAGVENTMAMLRESWAKPPESISAEDIHPQANMMPVRSTQAARALDATYMPRPGKPAGLEPPAEPVRSATASVPVIGTFERKPYQKGMGKAKK